VIREATSELIFHHLRRVFVSGSIHARTHGLEPDPELRYLASHFHDTGLPTPYSEVEQRFEIDGADHARAFLLDEGFPADSTDIVWTADVLEHFVPGFRRTSMVERVRSSPWPT
jgi:hypothetical protein